MTDFTHAICFDCWNERNPRTPAKPHPDGLADGAPDVCCFCGEPCRSGIYFRIDPSDPALLCREHATHDDYRRAIPG